MEVMRRAFRKKILFCSAISHSSSKLLVVTYCVRRHVVKVDCCVVTTLLVIGVYGKTLM